jgi:hypothetical protein
MDMRIIIQREKKLAFNIELPSIIVERGTKEFLLKMTIFIKLIAK